MNCHKKQYLTWSHAQADVRAMRRKKRCLTVYRCKHCNAFHVGEPLTERQGLKHERRLRSRAAVVSCGEDATAN